MPKAWSEKDERQYDEIKKQQKKQGRSGDRAKEIAARTVNKRRREEGRTKESDGGTPRTSGTGNPNARLENRSKDELYNRAQQLGIKGRSKMSKDQLIAAIRQRN